jgi:methyl-accepting chemotaxis protein
MKRLFAPLTRLLARLQYAQKFLLISLVLILPLGSFYPLLVQVFTRIDQYGNREISGAQYLFPLQQVLQGVERHENTLREMRAGRAGSAELSDVESQVDNAFAALQTVDRQSGAQFGTGTSVTDLKAEWDNIRAQSGAFSEADSQIAHKKLVDKLLQLIAIVGDNSSLVLDPDLNTYYTMDTVVVRLPEIQDLLARIAANAQGVNDRRPLTADERAQLIALTEQLRSNLDQIQRNTKVSLDHDADGIMRQGLSDSSAQTQRDTGALLDLLDQQVIRPPAPLADPVEYRNLLQKAVDANAGLYDKASFALQQGIAARRDRETFQIAFALGISLIGFLAGVTIGLFVMRSISEPLRDLIRAARHLAAGDLTARVNVVSEDEVGQVGTAFNQSIDALTSTVSALMDSSTKLSSSATQISAATNQMSYGAESQTQQVIRTSSAMEEISATIKEVARNAEATANATDAAATRAQQGSTRVHGTISSLHEANVALQRLRQRSAEIDEVVRLIADIAAQTNILSLNAAIEAAGAGAAGARFDVVAEEIRKLAGRTAESTARISANIAEIQREMALAAERMEVTAGQAEEIGQSLVDIVEGITSVNDMMSLVSSSTTQQARAADQVAEALQLITQVSQQTAQATRETAATIDDLSNLAHDMNALAGRFKVRV